MISWPSVRRGTANRTPERVLGGRPAIVVMSIQPLLVGRHAALRELEVDVSSMPHPRAISPIAVRWQSGRAVRRRIDQSFNGLEGRPATGRSTTARTRTRSLNDRLRSLIDEAISNRKTATRMNVSTGNSFECPAGWTWDIDGAREPPTGRIYGQSNASSVRWATDDASPLDRVLSNEAVKPGARRLFMPIGGRAVQ